MNKVNTKNLCDMNKTNNYQVEKQAFIYVGYVMHPNWILINAGKNQKCSCIIFACIFFVWRDTCTCTR